MFFRFQIPNIGNFVIRATDKAAAIRQMQLRIGELGFPTNVTEITQALDDAITLTDEQALKQRAAGDTFITAPGATGGGSTGGSGFADDGSGGDGSQGINNPVVNPGEFDPAFGIGATSFAPFALTEALKTRGIDTSKPGQGFLGTLFPEAQATSALGTVLGGGTEGTALPGQFGGSTLSPFANFVLQTLGTGGSRSLGAQAQSVLGNLAGSNPSDVIGSLTKEQQEQGGFTDAEGNPLIGDVLAQVFQKAAPGTAAGDAGTNLVSAALLQRLSPAAFSLFGQQLVNEGNRQFGQLVGQGRPPENRLSFLRDALRLGV